MAAGLTEKQKRFADEYLIDLNATQAAIRAKYSAKTADAAASRMLANVKIAKYIQGRQGKLQRRTEISQDKVLAELAKIGFSNIKDYLNYRTVLREVDRDENGDPVYDWAMIVDALDSDQVDGAPIQEVRIARDGTFIFKLYNKLDALEKIAKHLGLYNASDTDPELLKEAIKILGGVKSGF